MFKFFKLILAVPLLLLFSFSPTFGQSSVELTLDHTYSFERGYYNTYLEIRNNEIGLICPNLRRIYIIYSEKHKVSFITFENGKGPGEIIRGPFGIDLTEKFIYLGDPDAQRFSVYNRTNNTFKTLLYENGPPINGIYHYKGEFILIPPNGSRKLAYFIYDPVNKRVVKRYEFPEVSQNAYRYSGQPAVNERYLVHFNRYYGDLLIWDKRSTEFIKRSTVKEVASPESREAKLGNLTGVIPPQNPELKIVGIADNPMGSHQVFLLMESKDGEFKTNWIYNYNFIKDKIVGKEKLKANVYLIASNDNYLFAYSEEEDKLYQYKVTQ